MNTMTYKGYLGSVSYSDKDKVFYGKIEGINGLVNFEGESVKELTAAFHEAVDDYLAYCEDEGIAPDKSYTGVLNVRLTPSIHRQIAMLALQAGLSINAYIKDALEEKLSLFNKGAFENGKVQKKQILITAHHIVERETSCRWDREEGRDKYQLMMATNDYEQEDTANHQEYF